MILPGPRDEVTRQDDALVDEYLRHHFHLPPDEAPAPAASDSGQPEPSEDEQFAAYMRRYFPSVL